MPRSTLTLCAWLLGGLLLSPAGPVLAEASNSDRTPRSPAPLSQDELRRRLAAGEPLAPETLEQLYRVQHSEQEQVRLVLVPAVVEDRRGRPVRGLTEGDFTLSEDHIPQQIEFFSVEQQEPLALAFLLDVSGSMRQLGKLEAAKEAIRYFVETLRPRDRFALICFADDQVSWVTEFTGDRERFLARLDVQEGFGQTAINDAVAEVPKLVFDDDVGRKKAIVLITDGFDNSSRMTTAEALRSARRVNVPIYTIGFSALPESVLKKGELAYNLELIREFSEVTGGALHVVHDPVELKESAVEIAEELRHQYLIGYYPTRRVWDGSYRTLELALKRGKHLVRSRKGYYATP